MSPENEELVDLVCHKMDELRNLVAQLKIPAAFGPGGVRTPSLVIVAVGAEMTAELEAVTKAFVDKWLPIRPEFEVIKGGKGDGGAA